jgi:hypothetical protein
LPERNKRAAATRCSPLFQLPFQLSKCTRPKVSARSYTFVIAVRDSLAVSATMALKHSLAPLRYALLSLLREIQTCRARRHIASHRLIETLYGGEHIAGKLPPLVGRMVQLATGFHPYPIFCFGLSVFFKLLLPTMSKKKIIKQSLETSSSDARR